MKPDAFDYEGIFPGRAGRDRETAAKIEAWPNAGKLKHFDDPEYVPVPAPAPPVAQTTQRDSSLLTGAGSWIRRRGHSLSFIALF
ncbi:MAG TPA: hypothetical protein VFR51_11775, partial [Pyrinomonadaceae bacterium]|nr:hypothetical protein [Pyrinomonadaceae bacterium]